MSDRIDKGEWVKGIAHWREGDTAYISAAFTWRLGEARKVAAYYRAVGCTRVIAGGPATFTRRARQYLEGHCEVVVGARIPDTIRRHNPMATRASYGCSMGCSFCIVTPMDGKAYTLLPDFPVRPVLCDDNLSDLPADFQKHIVARYQAEGVRLLDANSGFEPHTFDDEVMARWKPILHGPWRFGFDEQTEGDAVRRVFAMLKDVSPRKKQVYTMIGREPFDHCMDRIRKVIGWGGEPYAQPFLKLNALTKTPDVRHDWTVEKLRRVARWVNWRGWKGSSGTFRSFEDYDPSARSPRRPA